MRKGPELNSLILLPPGGFRSWGGMEACSVSEFLCDVVEDYRLSHQPNIFMGSSTGPRHCRQSLGERSTTFHRL